MLEYGFESEKAEDLPVLAITSTSWPDLQRLGVLMFQLQSDAEAIISPG